jgi:polysaccharide export outer membrane protein
MPLRSVRSTLRVSIFALGLAACASGNHGPFVWVNDYAPAKAPSTGYVIGVGDQLSIDVFKTEGFATKEAVRPDGKISIPLLGDVTAADKAPATLAHEIELALIDRKLVIDPHVSVRVDAMKPLSISVLGKVARPGAYVMESGSGVAQAIASAGGLTDFAKKDQIYLTRTAPAVHLRFTFDQLTGQNGIASQFKLKTGDVIVVY